LVAGLIQAERDQVTTSSELRAELLDTETTINHLMAEVRRLNPSGRTCPMCEHYPMVLIQETEPPREGEVYWTCPGQCDVEWYVHPDDAPPPAIEPTDDFEAARAKAERNNLTWYLWMGSVVVMDGGKRARLCSSGEFTVEGHNWTAHGGSGSMRTATDEEKDLWRTLP
jgi:hypothetical protein